MHGVAARVLLPGRREQRQGGGRQWPGGRIAHLQQPAADESTAGAERQSHDVAAQYYFRAAPKERLGV